MLVPICDKQVGVVQSWTAQQGAHTPTLMGLGISSLITHLFPWQWQLSTVDLLRESGLATGRQVKACFTINFKQEKK